MNIRHERGWHGAFTRDQVVGAIANGTVVIKRNSEPGDAHPDGTRGVILGSIKDPRKTALLYFIEWEPRPKTAVGTMDFKVRIAPN